MAELEPTRHLTMFDPTVWGDRRVDILGLGASGSMTAQLVARLGVQNLHLHDHDVIGDHNIANQMYPMAAIGRGKAETCRDLLKAATGIEPTIHGKCEGPAQSIEDELGDIVFLCLDSMSARAGVVKDRLRMKPTTQLVIDPRMGVEEFRVYNFCPYRMSEVRAWEATITDDSETQENACQTRTTIGATAAIVAGLAVHQMLQWYRRNIVRDNAYGELSGEIMAMVRPPMFMTR
jgi:molybdopterin/thiamine biosynthesis adenylyltransferase